MRTSFTKNMDGLIKTVEKRVKKIRKELGTTELDMKNRQVAKLIVEVEQAYCFAGILKSMYKNATLSIPGYEQGTFDCIKTLKDLARFMNTPLLAHTKYLPEDVQYVEALFRALYAAEWGFDDAIIEKFRLYLEHLPKLVGDDFLHIQKTTLEPVSDDLLNSEIVSDASKIKWKRTLLNNSTLANNFVNNKSVKEIYADRLPLYKEVLSKGILHNPCDLNLPNMDLEVYTLQKLLINTMS